MTPTPPNIGECPYRGLRVLDVQHAPFFFGREHLLRRLFDCIQALFSPINGALADAQATPRFVAMVGTAGCGKSSLARAGLLAALPGGAVAGGARWRTLVCRPGRDPLRSLATALAQEFPRTLEWATGGRDDERALHIAAGLALRDAQPNSRLLVLVDQFEEVFSLCDDEALRRAWINQLLYAASQPARQVTVLATLRADFYDRCLAYPALAAALSEHQVVVGPLDDDGLRRAIEQPARLTGGEFEPALVERLLQDAKDQPDGMALLWHALWELWQRGRGQALTLATYRAIGGLSGALEQRAETVYAGLNEVEKAICRRLFLHLAYPPDTPQIGTCLLPLQDMLAAGLAAPDQVTAVIQTLAAENARLLNTWADATAEGQAWVEVTHVALLRNWLRLRQWIEDERKSQRARRRLSEAAQEWLQRNKDDGYLYRGGWLAGLKEWAAAHPDALSALDRDFLSASQRLEADAIETMRRCESLREMDRLKTRFVANMSHELRTPLNSILGFSRVILKGIDGPLNDLQRQDMTSINSSGQHLLGLINDMLDIFRLEVEQVELTLEEVDLKEVIKSVMSTAIGLIKDKPIALRQEVPEDLPAVRADPARARQVLLHLMSNATKFTDKGAIVVEAVASSRFVQVSIRDTGVGIRAERLRTIFEPFTQVDPSPGRRAGSAGLGLAISKRFVDMHGGQIWVESKEGVGSTFYFTLPRAQPGEADEWLSKNQMAGQ